MQAIRHLLCCSLLVLKTPDLNVLFFSVDEGCIDDGDGDGDGDDK